MSRENFNKVIETEKPIISDKEQVKKMSPEERKHFENTLDEICITANELAEKMRELDPELARTTIEGAERMRTAYQNVVSDIMSEENGD